MLELTDLVLPDEPVLVRRIRSEAAGLRLVVHCRPELGEGRRYSAAYVDPGTGALVFYRRNVALAVAVRGGAEASVSSIERGRDDDHTLDAPLARRGRARGRARRGGVRRPLLRRSPAEALAGVARGSADFASLEEERRRHDSAQLALAAPLEGEPALDALYRRSLLTLELLTDRETGATIAAPEFDPDFVHSRRLRLRLAARPRVRRPLLPRGGPR